MLNDLFGVGVAAPGLGGSSLRAVQGDPQKERQTARDFRPSVGPLVLSAWTITFSCKTIVYNSGFGTAPFCGFHEGLVQGDACRLRMFEAD